MQGLEGSSLREMPATPRLTRRVRQLNLRERVSDKFHLTSVLLPPRPLIHQPWYVHFTNPIAYERSH